MPVYALVIGVLLLFLILTGRAQKMFAAIRG